MRVLRRAALEADEKERTKRLEHGESSVVKGTRQHVSTDGLPEYRVELCPTQFVEIAQSGIKCKRPEPTGHAAALDVNPDGSSSQTTKRTTKKLYPHSNMCVWIPISMVRQVYPCLVTSGFRACTIVTSRLI